MINLSETIIYTCISMCPYPRQMPKYWEFWHTDVNRKQTERLRQLYNDSHMNELIYPGASEHLSFEPYAHTSSTVSRSDFNETAFASGDRSHLRGRGRGCIGHFSSGTFLFAGSAFYLLSLLLLIPEKKHYTGIIRTPLRPHAVYIRSRLPQDQERRQTRWLLIVSRLASDARDLTA